MPNLVNVTIQGLPAVQMPIHVTVEDSNNDVMFSDQVTPEIDGSLSIDVGNTLQDGDPVFLYLDNGEFNTNLKAAVGRTTVSSTGPWMAVSDGVTKYWTLTEAIPIPVGGTIEFDLFRPTDSLGMSEYILSGESDTDTSCYYNGQSSLFLGVSGYLTNLTVDGLVDNISPADGTFHKISVESTNIAANLKNLGCRFSFERVLLGAFKNLTVKDSDGTILNQIPLTNKNEGSTQIATVGNVNAIMANYTGDEWRIQP